MSAYCGIYNSIYPKNRIIKAKEKCSIFLRLYAYYIYTAIFCILPNNNRYCCWNNSTDLVCEAQQWPFHAFQHGAKFGSKSLLMGLSFFFCSIFFGSPFISDKWGYKFIAQEHNFFLLISLLVDLRSKYSAVWQIAKSICGEHLVDFHYPFCLWHPNLIMPSWDTGMCRLHVIVPP